MHHEFHFHHTVQYKVKHKLSQNKFSNKLLTDNDEERGGEDAPAEVGGLVQQLAQSGAPAANRGPTHHRLGSATPTHSCTGTQVYRSVVHSRYRPKTNLLDLQKLPLSCVVYRSQWELFVLHFYRIPQGPADTDLSSVTITEVQNTLHSRLSENI